MTKSIGKTIHIKRLLKNNECEWFTVYNGEIVPEHLLKEFIAHGGVLEKVEKAKVVEPAKPSDEVIAERIKDFAEDLKDDGKRNNSNDPTKKTPGRKKSKKW